LSTKLPLEADVYNELQLNCAGGPLQLNIKQSLLPGYLNAGSPSLTRLAASVESTFCIR